jgi:hypothetical protein
MLSVSGLYFVELIPVPLELVGTQPVNHTVSTSPTRWIKTRRITASVITAHTLNKLNCQNFNDYPFLNYIYNSYLILTESIILIVLE